MKAFIIVIAVATVLGGFVGGELTGNTFMLTGAVIGGVGTAVVLLGLGAIFSTQDERKRKAGGAPPLTPEIREVFARMAGRAGTPPGDAARPSADDKPAIYRRTVAGVVRTQLMTDYAKPSDAFGTLMTNRRAAGYVFGLSDAMLQTCGLRDDADEAKDLMEECYKEIFGDSSGYALLSMSLHNQDELDFHAGRMEGGNEMAEFIDRKTPPLGLSRILLGGPGDTGNAGKATHVPASAPTHGEFGTLMFEIQRVFRRAVSVPPPTDTTEKVLQNSSIYGAITPFAYGLAALRLAEADSDFIGSSGHEKMRRMVEDRLVKNRSEIADGLAAGMPKLPDGLGFQADASAIRRKVQEELRTALEAVADGATPRPRIAAQANLLQAYIEAAPFAREPDARERLLAEMSAFSDSYLRNGLKPD